MKCKTHVADELILPSAMLFYPTRNSMTKIMKSTLHYFHDTDNPMTAYGHSGKLCHMLSVTLMIQQPYIVGFGYCKEFLCHTRICKASGLFFVIYSCKMMIQ